VSVRNSFYDLVLSIVKKIPHGKVLTYGQVATIAGSPRASRIVGGILFRLGPNSKIPWHRVINRMGGVSTDRVGFGERQRKLLIAEGFKFSKSGKIDLKKYQWNIPDQILKQISFHDEVVAAFNQRFSI
jgi:methylated-DNA-protein-cysteine methyltransferase-like protein